MFTTERSVVARDIMPRLKCETAQLHARIDATVESMLGDITGYQALLAGLYDAYFVIEHELAGHVAALARAGYKLAERTKLGWLEEDLKAFGSARRSANHPSYVLADSSIAFGAVYVIEGATLGGQVIARQVIPGLVLSPSRGCRFFSGYGADTGDRWRETRDSIAAHLASVDTPDSAGAMIDGAKNTFSLIDAALHARRAS